MKSPDIQTIKKTLENTATPEEARWVANWFSTPEGSSYLSELLDEDRKTIRPGTEDLYAEYKIPSEEMRRFILSRIRWQHQRKWFFRIAAILIPFVLLIVQFWYVDKQINLFDDPMYEEIYVPKGERWQVVFQDGSKAILNAESRIKYPRKFGFSTRIVELDGEAFFDINTNKNRPFIVDLKDICVKVTGTSFNIKAYRVDSILSVSLEKGKVTLQASPDATTGIVKINPGEKITYNRESGKYSKWKPVDISANSSWKNNVLIFNNTPLREVIETLSRKYNADFEIADSTAFLYHFTLTSAPKDIWDILYELEKISPVRFERKEKTWIVRKNK